MPKILALLLLSPLMALAKPTLPDDVIVCSNGNVVLFENATSPDGRYAIGWTLRPHQKDSQPVDWSQWTADDPSQLLDNYDWDIGDKNPPYELVDCVVDLKQKKLLDLPSDDALFPRKNHSDFGVFWIPATGTPKYALVRNDIRFSTNNLWLVTFDASGMHEIDVVDALNKAVDAVVRDKRPIDAGRFETCFFSHWVNPDDPKIKLQGDAAVIPFYSDIPKSDQETEVNGFVTLHLPDGKVTGAESNAKRDDPFKDSPELAKTDQELNDVYARLFKKLSPADRDGLKAEQLDWIQQRDDDAYQAEQNDTANDPDKARIQSLLDSTQKRIAELKKRVK